MLFKSKQVSLPKSSSILQKMKIGQNSIYALFAQSPSNTGETNNISMTIHLQHDPRTEYDSFWFKMNSEKIFGFQCVGQGYH